MTRYLLVVLAFASAARAEHVIAPKASYIDVSARHRQLKHNKDPRIAEAIASLKFCTKLEPVEPPVGRILIPQHYLSGSHGPTNPAEAAATRVYNDFERRVTTGMNQWLVTASKDEASCAQQQIDQWAKAGALLDYDPQESRQAWYQVEWTLSSIATAESVLVNEPSLNSSVLKRDISWLNRVAHRMVDFADTRKERNNHYYWRGLGAVATGVLSSDDVLFTWGIEAYRSAIDEIDQRGALPLEMARHERALNYQGFALQPLLPLAAFAERQHVPLMHYRSPSGRTISDAVNFLGEAIANPEIIKAYTPEEQDAYHDFSAAEFYAGYFPSLPPAIARGLERPTSATRIGGNTTILSGYISTKQP